MTDSFSFLPYLYTEVANFFIKKSKKLIVKVKRDSLRDTSLAIVVTTDKEISLK